jgi:chromosome segregation ATPase
LISQHFHSHLSPPPHPSQQRLKLEAMQRHLDQLLDQIHSTKQHAATTQHVCDEKLSAARQVMEESERALISRDDTIEQLRTQVAFFENRYDTETHRLNQRLDEQRALVSQLREDLHKPSQIAHLSTLSEQQAKQLVEAKDRMAQLDSKYQQQQQALETLHIENAELRTKCNVSDEQLTSTKVLHEEHTRVLADHASATTRLEQLQADIKISRQECKDLTRKQQGSQEELQALRSQLTTSHAQQEAMVSTISRLESQLEQSASDLRQVKQECSKLQASESAWKTSAVCLEEKVSHWKLRHAFMQWRIHDDTQPDSKLKQSSDRSYFPTNTLYSANQTRIIHATIDAIQELNAAQRIAFYDRFIRLCKTTLAKSPDTQLPQELRDQLQKIINATPKK